MQPIRQTYIVPPDNILHLKVPTIPRGQEVEVVIFPREDSHARSAKHARMASASSDLLFVADIEEVSLDFSAIDREVLR